MPILDSILLVTVGFILAMLSVSIYKYYTYEESKCQHNWGKWHRAWVKRQCGMTDFPGEWKLRRICEKCGDIEYKNLKEWS